MLKKIILLTACIGIHWGFCFNSVAQSGSRLEEIRVAISENESRIEELKNSMALLQVDLKKLNNSIKVISEREEKLRKELSKVQSSQVEVERLISDLKGRLVEVELRALARIRALYMTPRKGVLTVAHKDSAQFDRAIKYAAVLKAQDRRDLEKIHELRGMQTQETTKLEHLKKQQTALLAENSLQRTDLEKQKKSVEKIVAEFNSKKKSVEKELLALRSQELRLEAVLKDITGGGTDATEGGKEASGQDKGSSVAVPRQRYEGEGFPQGKTKVVVIAGDVTGKFGAKVSGVALKGIVVKTSQATLHASIPGRVSFVGKMPRLGTVVILDHGNRDYTLFGKLKSAAVRQGDEVSADDTLADIDLTEQKSGEVYIETRKEGKPVNPLGIYKTS